MTYANYKIEIAKCTRPNLSQRRLDVVQNGSYDDMILLSGDRTEMLLRRPSGAHLELELFECDGREHKVDVRLFTAGDEPMNDPGSELWIELVSVDEVETEPTADDALHTLDQLDEKDDDLEHGWPSLKPNIYAEPDGDDELLMGAVI